MKGRIFTVVAFLIVLGCIACCIIGNNRKDEYEKEYEAEIVEESHRVALAKYTDYYLMGDKIYTLQEISDFYSKESSSHIARYEMQVCYKLEDTAYTSFNYLVEVEYAKKFLRREILEIRTYLISAPTQNLIV